MVLRRGTHPARTKGRISRRSLARFCEERATDEYTLVVHSVDIDHRRYFPNAFVVSRREQEAANLYTDAYYHDLRLIGSGSFNLIVCTGLLEHIPDPDRLIGEFHRILKPGGRLVISASAVFPFHGAPDNFFHFTPNGFRLLFKGWSRVEVLRGSSRPFETIAILLHRIALQCEVAAPMRLALRLLHRVVPALDVFVGRNYATTARRDSVHQVDTFMPAALHAVVVK